ncbi:Dipeptidyl-peptidase 6 [uncultured Eubacteriales bacterium]|uniref:Dipeptidyl-peptidase 6 n=1 Tax=uncultured Eubacteriales bacterium TaxID=172733 RepID=A0A212IYX5_9FIRM|nr:Dipeptidyl-peptidase 6 [uncultured Eubacteriales bacterium]
MKALVMVPICPLMLRPGFGSERADEVLLGMEVEFLENAGAGWRRVRTHYGYEGYAHKDCLLAGDSLVERWLERPRAVVLHAVCDVLAQPDIKSPVLLTLPRGAMLAPRGDPDENGWQAVLLPDGRTGYVRQGFLGPYHSVPAYTDEAALRAAVTSSALSYLGAPYRWGGKTPEGIDCSGLTFMAYLLNGVIIWRDARIVEGYPVHPIPPEALRPADLIFFPGHVAMYLGDGRYVHSTARAGSDGVVINSLDPAAPDYRPDLAERITAFGSIF